MAPSEMAFWLMLARGDLRDLDPLAKFGRNSNMSLNDPEDIWDGNGLWSPPTQARIHDLVSTSPEDDGDGDGPGGMGARTIEVLGLNGNFQRQSEIRRMNGLINVPTQKLYSMIYRMEILKVGSAGWNLGNITATARTDGTVTAQISNINSFGMNKTLMAIYQVPAKEEGYVTSFYASMNKGLPNSYVDVYLMKKLVGGPWVVENVQGLHSDGTSRFRHSFVEDGIVPYPSKTLIKILGVSTGPDVDVSAGFGIVNRKLRA